MIKILISLTVFLGFGLYAADNYDKNMDKKIYYDADRTKNDTLQDMSEVLEGFITSETNSTVVQNYKNGKLKLSQEELDFKLENSSEDKNKNTINKKDDKKIESEEPGFFASMFEKIGIGSTKKLPLKKKRIIFPKEEISKKEVANDTNQSKK